MLSNLPGEICYMLLDMKNEDIVGVFFEDELVGHVAEEKYGVTILKTHGCRKNKEHFVEYDGYPNKFNEWLLAKNVE